MHGILLQPNKRLRILISCEKALSSWSWTDILTAQRGCVGKGLELF